ncbi:unnamed protein product [Ambrosiozyma monospora]|uniref:Unnamed protein product n=1 Tax=Ambrosiozyma monospora TaxID=43982 RepID=A0ACB5TH25_AMBMO|nr:unnamed protein product [Ambrosiozyma monospora]
MALLSQWESEFGKANKNTHKKCYIYYGNETLGDLTHLLCKTANPPTVVLTTYGTVQSEFVRMNKSAGLNKGGLFSVKFFRIILDEGHTIRNKATKTAKAIYALDASRRWILTGTPVINRLDDFYSLIRFLKMQPWSHYSLWKYFITTPFDTGKDLQLAFGLLKTILDPLLLRRTKNQKDENGNLLVELPPKDVVIEKLSFNEKEQVMYNWLKTRAVNSFKDNISKGVLMKNYSSILTHLLRLRQVCDHVDLIAADNSEALAEELGVTNVQKQLENELDEELVKTIKAIETEEEASKLSTEEMIKLKDEIYETYPTFDETIECSICTNEQARSALSNVS